MVEAEDGNNGKLLTELRRDRMAELVDQRGQMTSDELARAFDVSPMTIWRDLASLESAGRLRRVRGGVVRVDRHADAEPLFVSKQVVNRERKEVIARTAAEHYVDDGDIIFIEAGTTALAMVKYLTRCEHLTVIGNGLGMMNELARLLPGVAVYGCGGMLRPTGLTFVGPQAEEFFRHVNARTCFLSATGLSFPEGLTDVNMLEIQVKRVMAASASRVVLLLDSTKFGVKSLAKVIELEPGQTLITDAGAPADAVARLAALGLEVQIAK
jgi:DeoR/GlpR family transcriptional regulator of sugar metabolism